MGHSSELESGSGHGQFILCIATHPCRSRIDAGKSDRTLGGGWWKHRSSKLLYARCIVDLTLGGGRQKLEAQKQYAVVCRVHCGPHPWRWKAEVMHCGRSWSASERRLFGGVRRLGTVCCWGASERRLFEGVRQRASERQLFGGVCQLGTAF